MTDTDTPIPSPLASFMGNDIMTAFALLDVCTDECDRYETKTIGSELWMMLAPTDQFRRVHVDVYRAHIRELLERAAAGKPLDTMTRAEVLLGLVQASLAAPLNATGAGLYAHLFEAILGDAMAKEAGVATLVRRGDAERVADELADIQRRVSPEGRARRVDGRPKLVPGA